MISTKKIRFILRILETPDDMQAIEDLQRLVWPGSETDVIPLHVLVTFAHNGGVIIGAYTQDKADQSLSEAGETARETYSKLIGFVCGFPGLYYTPDGPRLKHCSHELGVHPDYRQQGVGFALKRAQWQMVRHQGLDLITWTYDPLLSTNAFLNIARLGGVCSTYLREVYGTMRDGVNAGLPSDRFQVDWWINTSRVQRRLSRQARRPLDLAHFLSAGAEIINPTQADSRGYALPDRQSTPGEGSTRSLTYRPLVLVEIPADFQALKSADPDLGLEWRMHTRSLFEDLFKLGYLVVDFVRLQGQQSRSFYLLSHGENTL